jgi:hypothetical protein
MKDDVLFIYYTFRDKMAPARLDRCCAGDLVSYQRTKAWEVLVNDSRRTLGFGSVLEYLPRLLLLVLLYND